MADGMGGAVMVDYINRGPDPRVLGKPGAYLQAWLSWPFSWLHDWEPPQLLVCLFPPFVSLAVQYRRRPMRVCSLRVGWRYDKSARRYIADVIIKLRMNNLTHYAVVAALTLGAVGCGARRLPPEIVREVQTVEVKVPYPVVRTPPTELFAPIAPPLPVFVPPDHPEASSALTVVGERLLRGMLEEYRSRIREWEAWARAEP